jgi:hypothetical protein
MRHRSATALVILLFIFAAYLCLYPQPASAAQVPALSAAASPNSAISAATPAAPDSAPADTAADSAAKKPKKVWTNEEVSGMRGPISVVGDSHGVKSKNVPLSPADPKYIANTRKQLQQLQGQIADADKQLATLKDFSAGEPVATADREFHKGYNSQPIDQQIRGLETKKKDLQDKIDALLDEARKKGVEPGQLR